MISVKGVLILLEENYQKILDIKCYIGIIISKMVLGYSNYNWHNKWGQAMKIKPSGSEGYD